MNYNLPLEKDMRIPKIFSYLAKASDILQNGILHENFNDDSENAEHLMRAHVAVLKAQKELECIIEPRKMHQLCYNNFGFNNF